MPKRRILLLSNGNNDNRNGLLPRIAYEWLSLLQSETGGTYQAYVRYHPNEREEYKALGMDFDQSLNNVSLYDAIKAADVVMGYVSTTLLEAALIGRPVIQLLDQSAQHLCDYWKKGVTTGVQSYDEFRVRIQSLCHDDKEYEATVGTQRHHIHKYFHYHPHARTSMLEILGI